MPFEGGVSGTANGTLLFAVLLAAAYLFYGQRRQSILKVVAKTGSIGLLALLAGIGNGPWLLTLALVLCAAGDFFLAVEDRNARFFTVGLGAFLLGHLAYVALFAALAGTTAISTPVAAVIGVGIAFVAITMATRLWSAAGPLRIPVMVYITAIFAMGLTALATGIPLLIAGAASFIASDAVLAADRFLMNSQTPLRQFAGPFVWITYFAAQVLITLGILLA
ncbi:lysoplasmalogenase [Oricola cellulosilytica]|uniref:lysoplasmalogenase n=1 Tax=Oricola cellulosilytica TaxID=1429082 RepID=UPI001304EEBF|nr:lysoplasmalogenase [Oricola cellulosilytica]